MIYNKPPLTLQQQIQLLQERGLIVDNLQEAEEVLSRISYYRLSAYMRFYQVQDNPNHQYLSGTTFKNIFDLYKFDKSLRILTFNAIETIEIALRTQLVYEMSCQYGTHWYLQSDLFDNPLSRGYFHSDFIAKIRKNCEHHLAKTFIKHYMDTYTQPDLPPSYMVLEIISFGDLSLLYKSIKRCQASDRINNEFGVQHQLLVSWFHSLCYVRNLCAHHSRLWNTNLQVAPRIPDRLAYPWISAQTINEFRSKNNKKVFWLFCTIQYMLNRIKSRHQLRNSLDNIFQQYSSIDIQNMGFPEAWKDEPLWKT